MNDTMMNDNTMMMNNNNKRIIITFDIGGHIYHISKTLLLQFPNSMLYMTASDIETCNDNDPIYINRNGNRFQYVLSYMRDYDDNNNNSTIDLPPTMNREAFYNDMDFFWFPMSS